MRTENTDAVDNYVPPLVDNGRLEFAVFLSSRTNCPELRDKAEVALSELSHSFLGDFVRLKVSKWEDLAVGVGDGAQQDIEAQLRTSIPAHQIVIGFADQSIGSGTKHELLCALEHPSPRPYTLFFIAEHSRTHSSREDPQVLLQRADLLQFRNQVEGRHNGVAHDFREPKDFQLRLKLEVEKYVLRHLKARDLLPKPSAVTQAGAWPEDVSPYPGLKSMKFDDQERFFGREDDIELLMSSIRSGSRVLCIRGPSGIGKSSLLLAGLLPRMAAERPSMGRLVLDLSEGQEKDGKVDPFLALARAVSHQHPEFRSDTWGLADGLAGADTGVVDTLRSLGIVPPGSTEPILCVDQAEYLISRCTPEKAGRFASALKRSVDAGAVILLCTLRDDDEKQLFELEALDPLRIMLNGATHNLGRITRRGIVRAIREPAKRAGYTVSESLVERLADDADEPNSLPLLAAALQEIHAAWYDRWQKADHGSKPPRCFSTDLYPGFKDIIDRLASSALKLASAEETSALERLFWRTVRFDLAAKREYLVPVEHAVLASDPPLDSLVDRLDRARLLVSGATGVEFSHSSVLKLWREFAEWVERSRNDLAALAYYAMRAERWLHNHKQTGDLLSWEGTRAAKALSARLVPLLGPTDPRLATMDSFVQESRRIRGFLEGLIKADFELLREGMTSGAELTEEECGPHWVFYRALKAESIGNHEWDRAASRGFRPVHFAAFANNLSVLESGAMDRRRLHLAADAGWMPLHMAAYTNAVQAADLLVRAGCDPNASSGEAPSPLAVAASHGQHEMVTFLLACGASPDGNKSDNVPPLHGAIVSESAAILELLLESGADPNRRNPDGHTPLHIAAWLDGAPFVARLLEPDAAADPNARDSQGWTPIHQAAQRNSQAALSALIQARSPACDLHVTTNRTENPLSGLTALHLAAQEGNVEMCRTLVAEAPDLVSSPTWAGVTPLHLAATQDAADVVDLLVAQGATLEARDNVGETPLHVAARSNALRSLDAIQRHLGGDLLGAPARTIDPADSRSRHQGRTALHLAASLGHAEACRRLIDLQPGLVEATDAGGHTPLHYAAGLGRFEVAALLTERGANVTARTDEGIEPLHQAAANGHAKLCAWLLSHPSWGVSINARDNHGRTPLHYAASSRAEGTEDVVRLLVSGADIHAEDDRGLTPLHHAAGNWHPVVLLLLQSGADPLRSAPDGETPLSMALKAGNHLFGGPLVWATRSNGESRQPAMLWQPEDPQMMERAASSLAGMRGVSGASATWLEFPRLHAPWGPLPERDIPSMLLALEREQSASDSTSTLANYRILGTRCLDLPFYPGFRLVEFSLAKRKSDKRCVLAFLWGDRATLALPPQPPMRMRDLLILDGSSRPMHELSFCLPIVLDDESSAAAFLRFFTGYLAADLGSFLLVDSVEALRLPDARAELAWKALFPRIGPPKLLDSDDRGFRFAATVLYGRRLFEAELRVERWGQVDMKSDDQLHPQPLPTAPDRWEGGYRVLPLPATEEVAVLLPGH